MTANKAAEWHSPHSPAGAGHASDLPAWLYGGVPAAVVLVVYGSALLDRSEWLRGETGLVEMLTNASLLIAVVYLFSAVRAAASGLRAWLILLLVGTVYFAGEEMSWGQFAVGWQTPEGWKEINDQGETNLHNTWSLLDQLPRAMLTLAAGVGGILVPFYRRLRGIEAPALARVSGWWPTFVCVPACVLAVGVSPIDGLIENSPNPLLQMASEVSGGELKECLLSLFILIYAMSARRRLPGAA